VFKNTEGLFECVVLLEGADGSCGGCLDIVRRGDAMVLKCRRRMVGGGDIRV
jgi:hypothetical protein